AVSRGPVTGAAVAAESRPEPEPAPQSEPLPEAEPTARVEDMPGPQSFEELVALFEAKREAVLHTHLCRNVHLVRLEPGRLEFRPGEHAPPDLANRIGSHLSDWTGRRWVVSVSQDEGAPTLAEQAAAAAQREREEAARHPLVQAAQKAFPGAKITRVRPAPRLEATADPEDGAEDGETADD
ncbi:MAG: DNA polymerase III subunit gamma/tau, partial [Rhodospirillales bacterium]